MDTPLRHNHNELERQRRKNLTNLFNNLKHELCNQPQSYIPSNANRCNISKINILRQATICCKNFIYKETLRNKLINENKILKNRLSQLNRKISTKNKYKK
ncbi:MAG: helix-loop-helix domain-containing protein [Cetobacterium sp.]